MDEKLLDKLISDVHTSQELFGKDGFLKQLTKGLVQLFLTASMFPLWPATT